LVSEAGAAQPKKRKRPGGTQEGQKARRKKEKRNGTQKAEVGTDPKKQTKRQVGRKGV